MGDHQESVNSNRSLLPVPSQPLWLQQVHGTDVIMFEQSKPTPVADGCFSQQQNQVCAVMTADCLPLLLTDSSGSFVAALHCGWRGLANGIIETFLAGCSKPDDVIAWLGPAIGPEAFEVGEDVASAFADYPQAFVATQKDKYMADLAAITSAILNKSGVRQIYNSNLCTYTLREQFFSYRRDGATGRMATCIWLE